MLKKQSLISFISPWVALQESTSSLGILNAIEVSSLELDSRKIVKGDTFVAIVGHEVDGRIFISKAIENGANAVIAQACLTHEHGTIEFHKSCPVIYIAQLNHHLSALSGRLYQTASQLIGVTGTNGKTTITQLIAQWIDLLGKHAAIMGTTGNGFLNNLQSAKNTTASAIDIQRTLSNLSDQGVDYMALEVSSHGLVQGRVRALPFSIGIFTNLSRDHLDYHGTMEKYAKAKLTLFTEHHCKTPIINVDDDTGASWLPQLSDAVAVSIENEPRHSKSLWARNIVYSEASIQLSIDGSWGQGELTVPLIGGMNASNVLLSLATLLSLGFDKEDLLESAAKLRPVTGRMEIFQSEGKAKIVVDYAHTPDALKKALLALRTHCLGKLWVIFGCGGERDAGKRPMMAEIAERLADKVILTDDNPRSEDPDLIFEDMLLGMKLPEKVIKEHDRYQALKFASTHAASQDIILLAGKGHENYQVFKTGTVHYSDRESALDILEINE